MRTQVEIEQSIRENLAIYFDKSESVEFSAFLEKYNVLVDYATAVSEPFLRAETIRYQSILVYVSLLFVSVSLFQIGTIKIGESLVSVDPKLLVMYTIFIATITVIFLIKAYVDYQRAHFVRSKNNHVVSELQQLINIGLLKKQIQEYFWLEIFDIIGRACISRYDATSKVLKRPPAIEHTSMNVLNLDLSELRKTPDLATEIAAQEKFLAALTAELVLDRTPWSVPYYGYPKKRGAGQFQSLAVKTYRIKSGNSYGGSQTSICR